MPTDDTEVSDSPRHLITRGIRALLVPPESPTAKDLRVVGRIASKAADLLAAIDGDAGSAIDDVKADPSSEAENETSGDVAETTGVRIVRELLAHAPRLAQMTVDSPDRLTSAISEARRHGMTDVSAELERRLMGAPSETHPFEPMRLPSLGLLGVGRIPEREPSGPIMHMSDCRDATCAGCGEPL